MSRILHNALLLSLSFFLVLYSGCARYSGETYNHFLNAEQLFNAADFPNAILNYRAFLESSEGNIVKSQGGGSSESYFRWKELKKHKRIGIDISSDNTVLFEGFYRVGYAHYKIGASLVSLEKYSDALSEFALADKYAEEVGRGMILYQKARIKLKQLDRNQAYQDLQESYSILSNNGYADVLSDILSIITLINISEGKLLKAQSYANKALHLDVNNGLQTKIARDYRILGLINIELGYYRDALSLFEKAVQGHKSSTTMEVTGASVRAPVGTVNLFYLPTAEEL